MGSKVYIETDSLLIRQWGEDDLDPFFKLNSGLKVKELIVAIFSFLKIFMISFNIATSPILELFMILGIW